MCRGHPVTLGEMARSSDTQRRHLEAMRAKRAAMRPERRSVNGTEVGVTSDAPETEDGHGTRRQTSHLGSKLPAVPAILGNAQTFDLASNQASTLGDELRQEHLTDTHTTAMGANNSHEEINTALHATALALQERKDVRTGTGKLKRPSTGNLNPLYRTPTERSLSVHQRRLRPSQSVRPDTYDLEDSPRKTPQLRTKRVQQSTILPLKRQKRAHQQVSSPDPISLIDLREQDQQLINEQLNGTVSAAEEQERDVVLSSGPQKSPGRGRNWSREEDTLLAQGLREGLTVHETLNKYDIDRSDSAGRNRKAELALEYEDAAHAEADDAGPGAEVDAGAIEEDEALQVNAELDTQAAHDKNWCRDPLSPAISDDEAGQRSDDVQRRQVSHVEIDAPAHSEDGVSAKQQREESGQQSPTKTRRGRPSRPPAVVDSGRQPESEQDHHDTGKAPERRTRAQKVAIASPQKAQKQSSTRAQRSINVRRRVNGQEEAQVFEQPEADKELVEEETASEPLTGQDDEEARALNNGQHGGEAEEEPGSSYDGEGSGGENEDDDEQAASDEESESTSQQPLREMEATVLKPNTVFAGARDNPISSSPEKASRQSPRKRKRSGEKSNAAANTSKKRRRSQTPAEEVAGRAPTLEPGETDDGGVHSALRFYGQWRALHCIYKAVNDVGVSYVEGERQPQRKIKLRDAQVQAIVNLCDEAVEKLSNHEDPATDLAQIGDKVDALHILDEDSRPDFKNEKRSENIYFHLFPNLVNLLRQMISHYEKTDDRESNSPLTTGHLRTVKDLIRLIVDLGDGAKKYVRPPTELAIVRPVDNGIVAPLKKVHGALNRVILQAQDAKAYKASQQRAAEERALASQREEQAEQQRAYVKRVRDKWHQLHMERVWAEDGVPTAQKRRHLRTPNPQPEVDNNGDPFERVEVFTPRVGPPPAMVEAARQLVFTMSELDALSEGLRTYQGPYVFEKVFRKYCGRYGLLKRYNVTEIVTVAADLKEYLTGSQQRESGAVEDWVRRIPVWTKGHPLGKENVEGEVDDVVSTL